jgi:hypothetical protein
MKNLCNFIKVYDEAIPAEICSSLMEEYEEDFEQALVGKDRLDTKIRDCKVCPISESYIKAIRPEKRENLDNAVFEVVRNLSKQYGEEFGFCGETDTGYDLLKYSVGGQYVEHVDHDKDTPRTLSISILLNDNYKGGQLSFFNGALQIEPQARRAIVFPSNFMFPHGVMPVLEGNRFAVITWML